MNVFRHLVFSSLLLAVLSACSGAGEAPEADKSVDEILAGKNLRIVEEIKQLVAFNIHGWLYVNRKNVVLRDGPSKYYLVELNGPCRNLEFAQEIGFTSFGRVVRKNEFIVVSDASAGVERCSIRKLFRLEKIEDRAVG